MLFIAAGIGCVFAPDIGTLIALRFVQGLGIRATAVIVPRPRHGVLPAARNAAAGAERIAPLHVGLPLVWITFAGLAFVGTPGTVLALDPMARRRAPPPP